MNSSQYTVLREDRFFGPDSRQKSVAMALYGLVKNLPIISPHGHVDPAIFSDADYRFGSPTELFLLPDHYLLRMLYSQGIPLERLGIPDREDNVAETDHRRIWQLFCEQFFLFRGTPSGIWLQQELADVFDIYEVLTGDNALRIYDQIEAKLALPEYQPRALFERFNIELLCTTDHAQDDLRHHQAVRASGWTGRIYPTFRPDQVVNLDAPDWKKGIEALGQVCGFEIDSYARLLEALHMRRTYFRQLGAIASDHATKSAYTEQLDEQEAETLFQRGLADLATQEDALRFSGHMIMEMARMSLEDGLVMQWHVGAYRNHNKALFEQFGADRGADIPMQVEFTRSLQPLLNRYGNETQLRLILFTLDESTYSRELAPLAGHYPALRIGPPWWFHDSLNGMQRYFDRMMETAGLYNTAGFNDDTRAFLSIPVRHDVWRRASVNWVAGLVVRGIVNESDAAEMAVDLAYRLAKRAYRLESGS